MRAYRTEEQGDKKESGVRAEGDGERKKKRPKIV